MSQSQDRNTSSQWQSSIGFIAAAAGSAVGLGNIWKFPYITGENGGGTFVLFYLLCIAVLGLPIAIAEVTIGRTTQSSPVRAFQRLSGERSWWQLVGILGVFSGIIILSFYSVVAGWGLHYLYLSIVGGFPQNADPQAYGDLFDSLVRLRSAYAEGIAKIKYLVAQRIYGYHHRCSFARNSRRYRTLC